MLNDCCLKERERVKGIIKEVFKSEEEDKLKKHLSRLEQMQKRILFRVDNP